MKYLVDSLAIHDAFERLEGGASVGLASIGRIVRDTRQPSDPGVRTPSN